MRSAVQARYNDTVNMRRNRITAARRFMADGGWGADPVAGGVFV